MLQTVGMQRAEIRQIFYDSITRGSVREGYLPLDNTAGPVGWFEFWPMLMFVRETELQEDVWYGVVSPKFPDKACMTTEQVAATLQRNPSADVALFSYDWASLALHLNPWTQGDKYHPGLLNCMEDFLKSQGQHVDLTSLITDFDTSVLANYFLAKRDFWHDWRDLAERYLAYTECGGDGLPDNHITDHRNSEYPMRVFVQERLVCWLLCTRQYAVVRPDYVREVPLPAYNPFNGQPIAKVLLDWCEKLKRDARRRGQRGPVRTHRGVVKLLWLTHKLRSRLSP